MGKKRKIIAALADLKQDIAGPVPVDLISKWQSQRTKDKSTQEELMRPYERHGYIVSTDSAGLSRLTAGRSLLEVMKIVSEPKEVIFEMGRRIGGRGIGIWAADNSEMFYDASVVAADQLLDVMAAAQKVIHQGIVQVGMGMHKGIYWELGLGMFGHEAELVEAVAEDFTEGKEIVISESIKAQLDLDWEKRLTWREDLQEFPRKFFSLDYDDLGKDFHQFRLPAAVGLTKENFYPFPFSSQFFLDLKRLGIDIDAEVALQKYFVTKTVVLIKVYHHKDPLLLNQLTDWVVINAMMNEIVARYNVQIVKSNGDLGIFLADNDHEAVEFAEDMLLTMRSGNDMVSIGLARGEVLLFELDAGGRDIAGGAVNLASKISEDIAEKNTFYVEETVQVPGHHLGKFEAFEMEKSGVVIRGMRYVG